MGNIMTYSGISTKVRAMASRLLTDEDFFQMCHLSTVSDAVGWLNSRQAYASVFSEAGKRELHRREIERLLQNSLYSDYSKLYLFAGQEPRRFLQLYFPHYEVKVLKQCLRSIFDQRQETPNLTEYTAFFARHSDLDLEALGHCRTLEALPDALCGTPYQALMQKLLPLPHPTLFDYEIALDLMYFTSIWKMKNRVFSGADQKLLTQAFGSKLDLLNLQWIYRSIQYYHLKPEEIRALLIPVHYRVSAPMLERMLHTENGENFLRLVRETCYGKTFAPDASLDLEELYRSLLRKIYRSQSRKFPCSIACLNTYLFLKEEELHDIVTVIEGIRYRLPPDEIYAFIRSAR